MARDNQTWLADLNSEDERRASALNDLREIIVRMLPKALSRWLSPDSGHFEAFLQDVAQETLVRVLDRLETFEGRSKFTTWVYTIAIRIALSELRLRKWKEISLDQLEEGDEPDEAPRSKFANHDTNPETAVEQKQAMMMVKQIIEQELTPRQRTVMMAINVQGVPLDVIAQRIGSNRNAVYKMMHDARVKLKRRLELEGYPPDELLKMFGN
ncbi:MAG: RNA polymerase sigma factor [Brevefilum sp.]